MSDVYKQLNPVNFWIIHKSYIINVDYTIELGPEGVKLTDGSYLPISKAFRKDIKAKILERNMGERI